MEQDTYKIFITGVAEGAGCELVKLLIQQGHAVWCVASREDILARLCREVNSDSLHFNVCNLESAQDIEQTALLMKKGNFDPDIVVLNAAAYVEDMMPAYSHFLVQKEFQVNFFGALVWVDKFLPLFLQRGTGQFIGVASVSAFRPDGTSLSYSGSKAALRMAFRSLRLRYLEEGIKFKMVYFGPVASSLAPHWISPLGQPKYFFVLTAEQVAECIARVIRGRALDYFFPIWLTAVIRIVLFVPDKFFNAFAKILKQK